MTQLNFRYRADEPWALRDICLNVPAAKVTAIVGPSGSGKSTLLHLFARFYLSQEGEIALGGINYDACSTEQLMSQMSMVFQEVQLFSGSVLENVRIGRPSATEQEVLQACQDADCHQFIEALPQGYHTLLVRGGGSQVVSASVYPLRARF